MSSSLSFNDLLQNHLQLSLGPSLTLCLMENTAVVYLQPSRTEKYKTLMFSKVRRKRECGGGRRFTTMDRLLVNDVCGVCTHAHVLLSSHVGSRSPRRHAEIASYYIVVCFLQCSGGGRGYERRRKNKNEINTSHLVYKNRVTQPLNVFFGRVRKDQK